VLCDALAAAHAQGVIHRDVKPENIMLTATPPGLKLLDFGIAKLYDAVLADGGTKEAVVLGTPAYMAPEQVAPTGEVGERADVYAVGVILYQLLTTRLPVEAPTARELMARKLSAPTPELTGLVPELPATLVGAVLRCLHLAPAERPAAAELASVLRELAESRGAPPLERLQADPHVTPQVTRAERRRS
jgi:serine/threonine-protein kinase